MTLLALAGCEPPMGTVGVVPAAASAAPGGAAAGSAGSAASGAVRSLVDESGRRVEALDRALRSRDAKGAAKLVIGRHDEDGVGRFLEDLLSS